MSDKKNITGVMTRNISGKNKNTHEITVKNLAGYKDPQYLKRAFAYIFREGDFNIECRKSNNQYYISIPKIIGGAIENNNDAILITPQALIKWAEENPGYLPPEYQNLLLEGKDKKEADLTEELRLIRDEARKGLLTLTPAPYFTVRVEDEDITELTPTNINQSGDIQQHEDEILNAFQENKLKIYTPEHGTAEIMIIPVDDSKPILRISPQAMEEWIRGNSDLKNKIPPAYYEHFTTEFTQPDTDLSKLEGLIKAQKEGRKVTLTPMGTRPAPKSSFLGTAANSLDHFANVEIDLNSLENKSVEKNWTVSAAQSDEDSEIYRTVADKKSPSNQVLVYSNKVVIAGPMSADRATLGMSVIKAMATTKVSAVAITNTKNDLDELAQAFNESLRAGMVPVVRSAPGATTLVTQEEILKKVTPEAHQTLKNLLDKLDPKERRAYNIAIGINSAVNQTAITPLTPTPAKDATADEQQSVSFIRGSSLS